MVNLVKCRWTFEHAAVRHLRESRNPGSSQLQSARAMVTVMTRLPSLRWARAVAGYTNSSACLGHCDTCPTRYTDSRRRQWGRLRNSSIPRLWFRASCVESVSLLVSLDDVHVDPGMEAHSGRFFTSTGRRAVQTHMVGRNGPRCPAFMLPSPPTVTARLQNRYIGRSRRPFGCRTGGGWAEGRFNSEYGALLILTIEDTARTVHVPSSTCVSRTPRYRHWDVHGNDSEAPRRHCERRRRIPAVMQPPNNISSARRDTPWQMRPARRRRGMFRPGAARPFPGA